MIKRSECTCSCHTNPKMKHIVACCEPDKWIDTKEAKLHQMMMDVRKSLYPIYIGPEAMKLLIETMYEEEEIRQSNSLGEAPGHEEAI